jgi:hypothetical protein
MSIITDKKKEKEEAPDPRLNPTPDDCQFGKIWRNES